ncbi:hypothetical protein Pan216_41490 [Planctomycetes bacterium Pan216]|uniref:Cytochrome c domain-containing protein n=1 Tax=Kolteria novifilia TaxID=2527975 RepID=A0A518B8H7_9BACT|nr:hypothetical protein Pan216_41490 [Planctomycetes bacterium Pan216]
MRRLPKAGFTLAVSAVAVAAMFVAVPEQVQARPNYLKQFKAMYGEKYTDKLTCAVCHPGKNKKEKNAYGMAVGKALGAKKVKDVGEIDGAMKKAGGEEAPSGGTYGERIEKGEMPAG